MPPPVVIRCMAASGPEFLPEGKRQARQIQNQPVYAAMIESLDESVGRVMDKLALCHFSRMFPPARRL